MPDIIINNLHPSVLSESTIGVDSFKNRKQHFVTNLRHGALEDQKNGDGVTYVWNAGDTIVGYASISMFSIKTDSVPGGVPGVRFKDLPAVLLGQLATHEDYEGMGMASRIILWLVGFSRSLSRQIGCRGIALHSDADVIPFYEKNNFIHLVNSKRNAMFLDTGMV